MFYLIYTIILYKSTHVFFRMWAPKRKYYILMMQINAEIHERFSSASLYIRIILYLYQENVVLTFSICIRKHVTCIPFFLFSPNIIRNSHLDFICII